MNATYEAIESCGGELLNAELTDLPTLDKHKLTAATKRAIDVVASTGLLIALSPVMLGVACAIKLTSPGPIIFSQPRLTEGGRVFTLFKFRSMVSDAEAKTGAVLASRGDSRVTPLGRFLRKTRLDELPQLFNVLRGEMSMIGPRPERPEIAKQLSAQIPRFGRRLGAKAGLTGLAQVVQGYPDGVKGYRRKLGLDVLYIKKQSIWLDLVIALRTIAVVLSGSGAR
ncbi:MAG: sugar transferase [Pseudomonadota bacterium]|jgi:lipopolysaccharide/colanic/teichoic acid biosynthesis glycosyltransferase